MELIKDPKTLAECIVNAICDNIYGRSGGSEFFDNIDDEIIKEELIPDLVRIVQKELTRR